MNVSRPSLTVDLGTQVGQAGVVGVSQGSCVGGGRVAAGDNGAHRVQHAPARARLRIHITTVVAIVAESVG